METSGWKGDPVCSVRGHAAGPSCSPTLKFSHRFTRISNSARVMCGRFTLKQPRRINIINFDDADLPTLPPRYNIAPTQDVLTLVERDKSREARMLQWGLIP